MVSKDERDKREAKKSRKKIEKLIGDFVEKEEEKKLKELDVELGTRPDLIARRKGKAKSDKVLIAELASTLEEVDKSVAPKGQISQKEVELLQKALIQEGLQKELIRSALGKGKISKRDLGILMEGSIEIAKREQKEIEERKAAGTMPPPPVTKKPKKEKIPLEDLLKKIPSQQRRTTPTVTPVFSKKDRKKAEDREDDKNTLDTIKELLSDGMENIANVTSSHKALGLLAAIIAIELLRELKPCDEGWQGFMTLLEGVMITAHLQDSMEGEIASVVGALGIGTTSIMALVRASQPLCEDGKRVKVGLSEALGQAFRFIPIVPF